MRAANSPAILTAVVRQECIGLGPCAMSKLRLYED